MRDGSLTNGSRGMEAKFCNEDTLFSLRFHLINLRYPRVGICRDGQGTAKEKKVDGANAPDTSRIDVKKRTERMYKTYAE